ncbi:nucleoside recognition domain-containing protein [Hydrogenibacillus schlegelii]|uniref:Nucleoside transporter/FeoB GTPase Gate domain-containing protein n=2 Tax=Hydrogenibacillus schlegelii TaxID=1484 RepID=A0A179IPQ1_HYDSH|nr:nucleoside recognition domain-containing protein [Hydrogenibacillus schlegelii]OAR04657.1 hypothetical protein SA87_08990 [Hydrogenibacillus schlegelii]
MRARSIRNAAVVAAVAGAIAAFLAHPGVVFHAARRGAEIWGTVVFPATLPFLILAELSLGLGIPHFFGVMLQPIMRPLFRLPGSASFALTVGLASGYPMTARLAVRMRESGALTRTEGERLVAFATTADPVFLTAAVAVGFFHAPAYAAVLASVHYGTAIALGILFRFYGDWGDERVPSAAPRTPGELLARAFQAMDAARRADGRPFGRLLSDGVEGALATTFLIGGLLIFFSVLMALLEAAGGMAALVGVAAFAGSLLGLPEAVAPALVRGLFEVTLGAEAAAAAPVPPEVSLQAVSAILAWAGGSVQAQVGALIARSDLRFRPFFFARILHAVLAAAVFRLVWRFWAHLNPELAAPAPAVFAVAPPLPPPAVALAAGERLAVAGALLILASGLVLAVTALTAAAGRWRRSRPEA